MGWGTPGAAAKVFGALSKAAVNVRAIAQGASERNISVVIEQKVTGKEAYRAYAATVRHFRAAAPGPMQPLLLPPEASAVAATPYWVFHPFGVEQRRAETLRRVAAVADRLGAALLWVAERDACLHCLAHAGWSVAPGDTFPPGLTYGDKPLRDDGVAHPPLHPGCRCQVRLWDGPVGAPPTERSRLDPAARLAAEARRSVVYGWTSYASGAATIRAMERLLRRGAALPPSVERRARELVRQGRTLTPPK